jgi:metal-responsive CopG/Arc/MetJ family transcriptional regulator
MANLSIQGDSQKITVTLPRALLARLREHVPARQRSRFILEAVEERLALEEQVEALEEAAGAWSDQNHPEMQADQDIDRWLADLRSSWGQRAS